MNSSNYRGSHSIFSIVLVCVVAAGFIGLWVFLLVRSGPGATPNAASPAEHPTLTATPPSEPEEPAATETPIKPTAASEWLVIHPQVSEEYLANPVIGWQIDRSDPQSFERLPETVSYFRRGISWMELNPAEGQYNWQMLDALIQSARETGKDASFRVYTMIGESFGGAQVPAWVLAKGAVILPDGEPDYSNCVYQQEWGVFVDALRQRYDGQAGIAFIDISGYGNFNEWSWRDQTLWDEVWAEKYLDGSASSSSMTNLDSQARRRLADMFIGGSFTGHQCTTLDAGIQTVSYSYDGFQTTQLVMPYAGIQQSTQYVALRRTDVGFRYDCLGRDSLTDMSDVAGIVDRIWPSAPVIFEFCQPDETGLEPARSLLDAFHGSLVHDNAILYSTESITDLLRMSGYRYFLAEASYPSTVQGGEVLPVQMIWQNVGNAPSYPRMGHAFELRLSLLNSSGDEVLSAPVEAQIETWMPASRTGESAPQYDAAVDVQIPPDLPAGEYTPVVQIIDLSTSLPIQLAIAGQTDGIYRMDAIQVR